MIAIDATNFVKGSGYFIESVDVNGENGLLKVYPSSDMEKFWYIGTEDRNTYTIIPDVEIPDYNKDWYYENGQFILFVPDSGGATGGVEP